MEASAAAEAAQELAQLEAEMEASAAAEAAQELAQLEAEMKASAAAETADAAEEERLAENERGFLAFCEAADAAEAAKHAEEEHRSHGTQGHEGHEGHEAYARDEYEWDDDEWLVWYGLPPDQVARMPKHEKKRLAQALRERAQRDEAFAI